MAKRAARRKRRVRNQVIAYIVMFLFIGALAGGVFYGVTYLTEQQRIEQEEQASKDAMVSEDIENVVGKEEDLVKPEPPVEEIPELTPEQKLDEIINATIATMPIEDKVAGLFIVTPEAITNVSTATKAGEGTKTALSQYAVGGLVYFAKNIQSAEQLTEMLSNSKLYSRYPLFLAVDEEGGKVARVAGAGLAENIGSAQKLGETGDHNVAYQAGLTLAGYLSPLGFNLDFAPVADVNNVDKSVIGERSFGSDATVVAQFVASMVKGLEEGGVSSCLKHFPGIGSTTADTHKGLATTRRTLAEFEAEEFAVFKAGIEAGADFVMVSHVQAPALNVDENGQEVMLQSTLSESVVTGYLRETLGFEGVIITDAMNMGAISEYYESDEAAVRALKAGCDMILMPEDFSTAYYGVIAALLEGQISEERIDDSLRRIYRIKYADMLEQLQ